MLNSFSCNCSRVSRVLTLFLLRFFGILASTFLFGIVIAQTYEFYDVYRDERVGMKVYVGLLVRFCFTSCHRDIAFGLLKNPDSCHCDWMCLRSGHSSFPIDPGKLFPVAHISEHTVLIDNIRTSAITLRQCMETPVQIQLSFSSALSR